MAPVTPLCKAHITSVEVVELEQVPVGMDLQLFLLLQLATLPVFAYLIHFSTHA
jgi:hypothetical protein